MHTVLKLCSGKQIPHHKDREGEQMATWGGGHLLSKRGNGHQVELTDAIS